MSKLACSCGRALTPPHDSSDNRMTCPACGRQWTIMRPHKSKGKNAPVKRGSSHTAPVKSQTEPIQDAGLSDNEIVEMLGAPASPANVPVSDDRAEQSAATAPAPPRRPAKPNIPPSESSAKPLLEFAAKTRSFIGPKRHFRVSVYEQVLDIQPEEGGVGHSIRRKDAVAQVEVRLSRYQLRVLRLGAEPLILRLPAGPATRETLALLKSWLAGFDGPSAHTLANRELSNKAIEGGAALAGLQLTVTLLAGIVLIGAEPRTAWFIVPPFVIVSVGFVAMLMHKRWGAILAAIIAAVGCIDVVVILARFHSRLNGLGYSLAGLRFFFMLGFLICYLLVYRTAGRYWRRTLVGATADETLPTFDQPRTSRPLVWGAALAAVAIVVGSGVGVYLWKDQPPRAESQGTATPGTAALATQMPADLPAMSPAEDTPTGQAGSKPEAPAPSTELPASPIKLLPGQPLGVDVILSGARIDYPRVYARAVRHNTLNVAEWKYEIRPKRGNLVLEISQPMDTGVGGFLQSGTAVGPFLHPAANPAQLLWVDQAHEIVDRSLLVVHSHPDPADIGSLRSALDFQAGQTTPLAATDLGADADDAADGKHATISSLYWHTTDVLAGQFGEVSEMYLEPPARELNLTYTVVRVGLRARRVEKTDFHLQLPDGRLLNPVAANSGTGFSPSWLFTDASARSGDWSMELAFVAPTSMLESGNVTFHFRRDRPLQLTARNRRESPPRTDLAGAGAVEMLPETAGRPPGAAMTEEQLRSSLTGPPAVVTYWDRDKKINLRATAIGYRSPPPAGSIYGDELADAYLPGGLPEPADLLKSLTKLSVAAKAETPDDMFGIDGVGYGDLDAELFAQPEATGPVSEITLEDLRRLEWKYTTVHFSNSYGSPMGQATPTLVAHVNVITKSAKERRVDVLPSFPAEILDDHSFSMSLESGYGGYPGMGGPVPARVTQASVSLLGITERGGKEEVVEIPLNFDSITLAPPADAPFDPATIDWDNLRSTNKRRQLERWTNAMIKQYKEELIHDIEFGAVGD